MTRVRGCAWHGRRRRGIGIGSGYGYLVPTALLCARGRLSNCMNTQKYVTAPMIECGSECGRFAGGCCHSPRSHPTEGVGERTFEFELRASKLARGSLPSFRVIRTNRPCPPCPLVRPPPPAGQAKANL